MDIDTLTQKIEIGLVWAEREGIRLIDGVCGSRDKFCGCALSVALWADGDETIDPDINTYMERFDLSAEDVSNFMNGFDGDRPEADDVEARENPFYKLGVQYRIRLGRW